MSKKRKKTAQEPPSKEALPAPARPPTSRVSRTVSLAVVALILTAGLLGGRWLLATPPAVPDPDTTAMEPQVVEKIQETRQQVIQSPRSPRAWGKLGMVFQAHGLDAEAASCYGQARERDLDEPRWAYFLAKLLRNRDSDRALVLLETAIRLRPSYAPAIVMQAQILEQANRMAEARASYEKALDVDARCTMAEFALGRLHLAEGHLAEARTHLERAARQQPYAGAIQAFLSRLYHLLGEEELADKATERARTLLAEVALQDPILDEMSDEAVSTTGIERRAKVAEAEGNDSKAERLHRQLVELHPQDAKLRYNLANLLGRLGKVTDAESEYRRTLKLDASFVEAHVNLGNLLTKQERLEEAISHYQKALASEPDRASALVNFSNALLQKGDGDGATELLLRVLTEEPDHIEALQGMGQILAGEGKLEEAIQHFQKALEQTPESGRLHFLMALTRADQGRFGLAWKHVREAERLGLVIPDDVLNALRGNMPEPEEAPRR